MGSSESVLVLPTAVVKLNNFLGSWWRVASAPATITPRTRWTIGPNGDIIYSYYNDDGYEVSKIPGSITVFDGGIILRRITDSVQIEENFKVLRIVPALYALIMKDDQTRIYLLSRTPQISHELIPEILSVLAAYGIDPRSLVAPNENIA